MRNLDGLKSMMSRVVHGRYATRGRLLQIGGKTPLGGTYEGVFSMTQLMSWSPVYIWRP